MNKIVAIVGMTGSGKSEVADYLTSKGYQFLRFGQITLDIVKERGLEPTEENEVGIREGVRKEHGPAAFAILNIPKIEKLLETGTVVADGLYSWSEYKVLKEKYGKNITVIAVFAPPSMRYKRLSERKLSAHDNNLRRRPATIKQSQNRDFAEIENIEKGGPIAMADYTIVNTSTKEDLYARVEEILSNLEK